MASKCKWEKHEGTQRQMECKVSTYTWKASVYLDWWFVVWSWVE